MPGSFQNLESLFTPRATFYCYDRAGWTRMDSDVTLSWYICSGWRSGFLRYFHPTNDKSSLLTSPTMRSVRNSQLCTYLVKRCTSYWFFYDYFLSHDVWCFSLRSSPHPARSLAKTFAGFCSGSCFDGWTTTDGATHRRTFSPTQSTTRFATFLSGAC